MDKNNFQLTENMSLDETFQILQKYDNTEFLKTPYKGCNCTIPTNFLGKRIKNGEYISCIFNGNSFQYTGAAGTRFWECEFISCDINGANMQFCDFSNSSFRNNTKETHIIQGTNFNQSCFYNSIFQNVNIENASICQSQFLDTLIENSHFRYATLQDNIFRDANIVQSSFIGCNLEYSDFIDVTLNDVILPFHQISYIYGGLQSLIDPQNSVKIVSSMQDAPVLSANEYIKLLPAFTKYYESECDYFPLANIALFMNDYSTAKKYIHDGLKEYIRKREFRKLKALCKLVVKEGQFDRSDLLGFYFNILEYYNSVELSPNEQHQYGLHIDEIKNILFGISYAEKSHIEIILKTNLTIQEESELTQIISIIEDCLSHYNINNTDCNLELKHNSLSYSFWIVINSLDPNLLVMTLGMLYSIFSGNINGICQALNVCANAATIASFINSLNAKKSEHNFINRNNALPENKEAVYAKDKHRLLKKETKIKFSVGNVRLNYKKKKTYQ